MVPNPACAYWPWKCYWTWGAGRERGSRVGSEGGGGEWDEDALPVHGWRRRGGKQHLYGQREGSCVEWSWSSSIAVAVDSHRLHCHSGIGVNGGDSELVCTQQMHACKISWLPYGGLGRPGVVVLVAFMACAGCCLLKCAENAVCYWHCLFTAKEQPASGLIKATLWYLRCLPRSHESCCFLNNDFSFCVAALWCSRHQLRGSVAASDTMLSAGGAAASLALLLLLPLLCCCHLCHSLRKYPREWRSISPSGTQHPRHDGSVKDKWQICRTIGKGSGRAYLRRRQGETAGSFCCLGLQNVWPQIVAQKISGTDNNTKDFQLKIQKHYV